jgi:hypothetical protein
MIWSKMASVSAGSLQGQRRPRQVGLSNPRSARGRANEQEIERVSVQNFPRRGANDEEFERVAIRNIMSRGVMGLDVPGYGDSDAETENMSPDASDDSVVGNGDQVHQDEIVDSNAFVEVPESPPEIIVARARARNRYFWAGNDGKLNLMASKYLNQPLRQELQANSSRDADVIAHIRSLKRDPAKDLDHDNLKHSGKLFLVQKTCDELNECELFKEYMPEHQTLGVELCRQKIREFQEIAVNTRDADIDRGD